MEGQEPVKKKNNNLWLLLGIPLLCIITVISFPFLLFLFDNIMIGASKGLGISYEPITDIDTFGMSKSDKCKIEASKSATSLLESKIELLKAKKNKTQSDLQDIEYFQGLLDKNMYLRDDYEYHYNDCMR